MCRLAKANQLHPLAPTAAQGEACPRTPDRRLTAPDGSLVVWLYPIVPVPLKEEIVAQAGADGVGIGAFCVSRLAARFGIDYMPFDAAPGRAPTVARGGIAMRVPPTIKNAVIAEAQRRNVTMKQVVVEILTEAVGAELLNSTRPGAGA